jgi:3-phenylpropionate/trans-cinnamate dioxygenase ferredoxin reductase component
MTAQGVVNPGRQVPTAAGTESIVIVGGGHAGVQLCVALVEAGQGARVHLVCAEDELPYQRPPLSKSFLKQPDDAPALHRMADWFAQAGVTVHRGDAAVHIDRAARQLALASGRQLPYDRLVLATGADARWPADWPRDLANVCVLRTLADARGLRDRLATATSVTVLGGGFIGLEVAATARAQGKGVTVIEAAPRLLMRSVSEELSAHVLQAHRAAGIDVRLQAAMTGVQLEAGRVAAVEVGGRPEPVDLLVLGIGAVPAQGLAEAAGLAVGNGIRVDARLCTDDPRILAIGDVAAFPAGEAGLLRRLESVQNANDQARVAAATLLGGDATYRPVPWFWSEQGTLRLQMAGLIEPGLTAHRRPGATPSSFSLLHYRDDRLVCVESANAPLDHLAARKLLEAGRHPPASEACDPARPLKSFG